ncbi:NADH:flavin oxidoreductase [Paenibacillus sp. CF384]|uniref:NADH:flavin oxidoreductase n=1 Tax=Paenibacillus sp. CF384 TaxID=1884382 RepID=UPI00089A6E94|nr:NADH:flavin oxidoreductase [Paenibacillus sp. CF384]SDW23954.1 2,4-dienoyl-CoA reductase [Paenibacillus sp. CF384]
MTQTNLSNQPTDMEVLFTPFKLGNLTLPNRIVMAPMTRGFSPDGVPGQNVADYYRRRAEGGVGLIITEGTLINHPAASSSPNYPSFFGEAALQGWAQVVQDVHDAGGLIFPQLWHQGTVRQIGNLPNVNALPVGPSGLTAEGVQVNEPLTQAEITDIVEAFAQGAADAKRLGFDGIEIHGAHGYLIDQFFWEKTNQRTDQYGGSLVARTRFAAEIIAACRLAVGPHFPICLRISQWKVTDYNYKLAANADELAQFLAPLVDAGVDIFHCSTRRFWEPEFEGSELNLAGWVKKITGKPTITVGSVGLDGEFLGSFAGKSSGNESIDKVLDHLGKEEFDLVAVGRAILVDPEWPRKIKEGKKDELLPFTSSALRTLS